MRLIATTAAGGLALLALLAAAPPAGADSCPNAQFRTGLSANLPDCRAYELVSPVDKHEAGVVSDSSRTRAAADGNAIGFLSLGAFGDAVGTGVATDYIAERTGTPGTPGWTTHAIVPPQSSTTYDGFLAGLEARYVGEFSPDLSTGVFAAVSPVTDDPSTANAPNLYVRNDLLTPGAGTYQLVTHCPVCDANGTPLPPATSEDSLSVMIPNLAWMSPDASHIAFESQLRLTADTPGALQRVEVYEWDRGTVSLAGRVPKGGASFCDDVNGPACVGSPISIAGQGTIEGLGNETRTPDVVSDGSDGHTRVFFTVPTDNGVTPTPGDFAGQLYMRVDGAQTVKLNVSERVTQPQEAFAPATFLDASTDGERAFLMTTQALTDDAPVGADSKIYMYDVSAPAGHHLTLINADHEPGDGLGDDGVGIVGLSDDGHYMYFVDFGQIVSGQPLLGRTKKGLYLWHDGEVRFVTSSFTEDVPSINGPSGSQGSPFTSGWNTAFDTRVSRVTPDGRWLLYPAFVNGTKGYANGTNQLMLYSVDGSTPTVPDITCVSCPPSGAPPTADSSDVPRTGVGGTFVDWHENHALSDDGSRVFFSTAQQLVPQDVNNKEDVYEYDVPSGTVHLISSGTGADDSWFLDASANGDDAFFTTSQQLVGWDNDQQYDLYDARVGGGFPDPPPAGVTCDPSVSCQGTPSAPPGLQPAASASFTGPGNVVTKPKTPTSAVCRRGFVRRRVKGRLSCVKRSTRRARRPARAHRHDHRRAR